MKTILVILLCVICSGAIACIGFTLLVLLWRGDKPTDYQDK